MCTGVRFADAAGNLYFGRNLDWCESYGEGVVITPRGASIPTQFLGSLSPEHACVGMGIVVGGVPCYFDCANEAGLAIAERASDDIGAMIAGGATVMLVFQAFLNIACVIGVFPTTGKPLPFISSGGTSMIASFILVGLVLSVSAAPAAPSVYEQRRADLRLVRRESAPPAPSGRARSGESSRSRSAAASGRGGSGRIDASARSRSARPSNRSNYRR